jgi:hypothetical protein
VRRVVEKVAYYFVLSLGVEGRKKNIVGGLTEEIREDLLRKEGEGVVDLS